MGSRSRSRSRSSSSGRLHLDRFGRVIPKSRRSRSHRSRSRSREHLRVIHYPRRRSRSRSRSRRSSRSSRRRSRDRPLPYRSRSRSRSNSPISGKTNIPDLKLMMSRVFIGNLPYDKITKEELEQMFAKYGKILGISIHERGFGFVQFEKEAEALEAVKQEGGSLLKGKNIDVKMALSGRRGGPPTKQSGPSVRPSPPPASSYDSDRYPAAGSRRPLPGAPAERERSPLRGDPYEDRYRDPYRDPVALPPRLAPPAAGVGGDSLPHRGGGRSEDIDRRDDPYRRPLPQDDPYYDRYRDDVYRYRRDPYPADPYRDPYYRDYPSYEPPPPARKPPPADVEIILMNSQLRNYGEFVERKLKGHNMVVLISVIPEDRTIQQVIEDSSKRGHLFAIVINSQNEAHQSLTVNILHGTPQEHRNMPVEDAMNLIPRSFDQYTQAAREKAAPAPERAPPPAAPSRGPPPFLPPGPDISYLLNLLADNRQVTLEEIDKVITYLRERKDKMYELEGRRPPVESGVGYGAGGDVSKDDSASLQQQQQELQAKILSILNGPGETGGQHPKTGRPGMPMGNGAGQGSGQGVSSLINFDNPSVQKALDNLIQSGPNLLKNISSSPANPSPNPGLMSREGEPMRHEGRMSHGGFGGNSMAGSAPMQQSSRVGTGGGQGPMGGMQPSQRPMYGSVAGAPQQRLGGPMPQQGMRRQF